MMDAQTLKKFQQAVKQMQAQSQDTQRTQAAPQEQDYRSGGVEQGSGEVRRAPILNMFEPEIEDGVMYDVTEEDRQRARENMPIGVMEGESVQDARERMQREQMGREPQSVNAPLGQEAGTQFESIEQAPSQKIYSDPIDIGADAPDQRQGEYFGDEPDFDQLMQDIEELPEGKKSEEVEDAPDVEDLKNPFERTDADKAQEAADMRQDEEGYNRMTAPSEIMKNATYQMPRSAGQSLENLMMKARRVIPSGK